VEVLQFSLGIRIHYNSRIIDTYFDDIYFRVMKNETKDYRRQLFTAMDIYYLFSTTDFFFFALLLEGACA
jgi:hypothetical protein